MQSKHTHRKPALIAGALAGLFNGFFGGGGGMILVPILLSVCKLPTKKAFATSISIIAPLCVLSLAIYAYYGNLDLALSCPYVLGGFVGGAIGGKVFGHLSNTILRRTFAIFILYAAWRSWFL